MEILIPAPAKAPLETSIVFDNPPLQNRTARTVDDGDEIKKAAADGQIRVVCRPRWFGRSIVMLRNRLGIDLVAGAGLVVFGLGPNVAMAHLAHHPLHALAIDLKPLRLQHRGHLPRAQEGQTVNSSSRRRIRARSLSFAGAGGQ